MPSLMPGWPVVAIPGRGWWFCAGWAGRGRRSVALAYAHRHLAEVGVAWQFAAEDPTVLAAGFAELAAQLGALDLAATRGTRWRRCTRSLAAFPGPWLLIFDNAPDRAAVERFLPPAGPGRVLITSRNAKLAARPGAGGADAGHRRSAADFLVSRTGDPDRQAAAELAAELGGLPLALEQAGRLHPGQRG